MRAVAISVPFTLFMSRAAAEYSSLQNCTTSASSSLLQKDARDSKTARRIREIEPLEHRRVLAAHASKGDASIHLDAKSGRVRDRVVDNFLAAYPEYEEVDSTSEFVQLARRQNALQYFGEWYRKWFNFKFPETPGRCSNHMFVGKIGEYLGSGSKMGLQAFMRIGKPVVSVVSDSVYNQIETPINNDWEQELTNCADEENTHGCMYLRNADCVPDSNAISKASTLRDVAFLDTPETKFCQDGDEQCRQMLQATYEPKTLTGSAPYPFQLSSFLVELSVKSFLQFGAPLRRAARSEVQSFVKRTRWSKGPCVAMHVRLGDKVPECSQGKDTSCSFLSAIPHYMPKAKELLKQLPGVSGSSPGAIFVMTDNATIISEYQEQHPDIHIDGISGSSPNLLPQSDTRDELAKLLASLQLASRCGAFVGNSESEVSEIAVMLSCHAQGRCPAAYSFQSGAAGSLESKLNGNPVAPQGILQLLRAKEV